MNQPATKLRRELQDAGARSMSDWNRVDLIQILTACRQERGGLSLMEISEVITSVLGEDAKIIKNNL